MWVMHRCDAGRFEDSSTRPNCQRNNLDKHSLQPCSLRQPEIIELAVQLQHTLLSPIYSLTRNEPGQYFVIIFRRIEMCIVIGL